MKLEKVKADCLVVKNFVKKDFIPVAQGPFESIIPSVNLNGKVVVVTGVSRGQGRATAQILKASGAIVIGTTRFAAGYPSPGQFLKPAFIPQVSPLLSTVDVPQTCDYLLQMNLSDDASMQSFSDAVHALFAGPLSGKNLYAIVNNASRVFFGDIIPSFLDPTALANIQEMYKIGGISQMMITSLLFDLMPSTSDARIIFMVSIDSMIRGSAITGPYDAAKKGLTAFTDGLVTSIGELAAQNPGTYTNFRVCTVHPNGVRSNGVIYPPISTPNGDIGLLAGANLNPLIPVFGPLLWGAPLVQDIEQSGNTIIQLLTMLEPPLTTVTTNLINFPDLNSIFNPVDGFPPSRDINDTVTLLKFNAKFGALQSRLGTPNGLFVASPQPWDIIPAAPGALLNPYTGAPIVRSAVPIITVALPFGDATFDFQYKINNGPWLGAGTFVFGVPFPPLYTATVDLSAYSGQTITISVRVFTHGGNPVAPVPTGNAIQTDGTLFFMKVSVE